MKDEAHFWDALAEKYSAKPIGNLPAYRNKVAITTARLAPGHRVLDVGCGTGSLALELAGHVAHVDAVDISSEMVRIACDKAKAQQVDNVAFHQAHLHALPDFEAQSFDCICAFNILHLVDQREAVLRSLLSLLKPGGTFVTSTPCLGESWVPYGPILAVMKWFGKAPTVFRLSKAELAAELAAGGLVEIEQPDVGAAAGTAFVVATKPDAAATLQGQSTVSA